MLMIWMIIEIKKFVQHVDKHISYGRLGGMKLTVTPRPTLHGKILLPGDKSISHRAALFAALAEGKSHFENFLVAGVTKNYAACLVSVRCYLVVG